MKTGKSLATTVRHLSEKIARLENEKSYLEERISKLEQKELESENV